MLTSRTKDGNKKNRVVPASNILFTHTHTQYLQDEKFEVNSEYCNDADMDIIYNTNTMIWKIKLLRRAIFLGNFRTAKDDQTQSYYILSKNQEGCEHIDIPAAVRAVRSNITVVLGSLFSCHHDRCLCSSPVPLPCNIPHCAIHIARVAFIITPHSEHPVRADKEPDE